MYTMQIQENRSFSVLYRWSELLLVQIRILKVFFTISGVPAGDQQFMVTYIGYDTSFVDIKIYTNGVAYEKIYLAENSINLKEISIRASREQARNEVLVSKITVTPKQIKALPSTGGEADIAQYLPVLPGIIFSGDQGG